jgi:hypothetical protein
LCRSLGAPVQTTFTNCYEHRLQVLGRGACLSQALRSGFPFFRQRIKIVSLFLEQLVGNQSFDGIEDCCASVGIVFARFEKSMQIELLFAPKLKTANHSFFDFSHGEFNPADYGCFCFMLATMDFTSGGIARPFASSKGADGGKARVSRPAVGAASAFCLRNGIGSLPSSLR